MSATSRILLALVAGLAVGAALLGTGTGEGFVAAIEPVGSLWLNGLRMTIIPLVLALLVVGTASAADAAVSGGLTARALGWFAALLVAGALFAVAATKAMLWLWPVAPAAAAALRQGANAEAVPELPSATEALVGIIPGNLFAALAAGEMLPIVLFGLVFAFAVTRIAPEPRDRLVGLFRAVADTMMVIVHWVLWLAPLGVFALALGVGFRTGFAAAGAVVHYVVIVSLVLILQMLLITYPAAAIFGRVGIGRFASACLPAQVVAFSTQSSLATLPAMLETMRRRLLVPEHVSDLVLPLAVALFRITSPAGNLAVVLVVAHIYGVELGWTQLAAGVAVAVVGSLSVVGVSSSVTFFVVLVPMSLVMGVPIELLPLLLPVEVLPDLWRTVGNVTADMAVTTVLARGQGEGSSVEAAASLSPADADR